MAKSRKTKPAFDSTPPAVEPDASASVHRSDGPTPVISEGVPPVIDVEPVSTIIVPPRAVSRLEHGIDLLSRPLGLVIMLGVAALGVFRSRRTLVLLLASGMLALTACRSQTIWSGVEFQQDGRLKLASQEPLCGCLTIVNVAGKDLALRSRLHGSTLGSTTLKAGAQLGFRFDWAGPENSDFYLIEATDAGGSEVNLKTAIRIEDKSGWVTCSSAACPYGELMLDMGETGR